MKILFCAGREIGYARNDVILRAFQRLGEVDIVGMEQRPKSLLTSSLQISLQVVRRILSHRYDLIYIGFYGHLIMLPVGLFSRDPILFDALLSTYDTLVEDRQAASPNSLRARAAIWLDRTACCLAEHVLLDTPLHIDYFVSKFGLPKKRFSSLPVGCNEEIFFPKPSNIDGRDFTVTYYSSYLPLHGVDVVVRAAHLLQDLPIQFRLIGSGQTYDKVRALAESLTHENIQFISDLPIRQLADEISNADVCLGGHFGATPKAGRVVPGKIYQILAMARPLIATNTPANLQLLSQGELALLCPANNPEELAESVRVLFHDPFLRNHIASEGYRLYRAECSEEKITDLVREIAMDLCRKK